MTPLTEVQRLILLGVAAWAPLSTLYQVRVSRSRKTVRVGEQNFSGKKALEAIDGLETLGFLQRRPGGFYALSEEGRRTALALARPVE